MTDIQYEEHVKRVDTSLALLEQAWVAACQREQEHVIALGAPEEDQQSLLVLATTPTYEDMEFLAREETPLSVEELKALNAKKPSLGKFLGAVVEDIFHAELPQATGVKPVAAGKGITLFPPGASIPTTALTAKTAGLNI